MFVAVKFNPADSRSYTYTYDGVDALEPGQPVLVQTKDGQKTVTVFKVDIAEPPFECKPIIGLAPEKTDLEKYIEENEPMIAVADAVSRGEIGHNNPPDPIDEALAPYGDAIAEAENWLDGTPVENEDQMNAVDVLIKDLRSAKSDLAKAEKSATAPLHDAWKAEIARWKPTKEDIERRLKGLAAVVDPFKRKLAEEKEAAKRKAYEEARAAERTAEEAAKKASAANYEEQAEADRLAREAMEAKKAASAANKDTVKGLRTVTKYEITDHRALLHFIAANDRDAVTAFIEEWARKNHKTATNAEGLRVWQEKEAY